MYQIDDTDHTIERPDTSTPLDGVALDGLRSLEALASAAGPYTALPRRLAAQSIELLPVFHQRVTLNEQAIADYARVLGNGEKLPALTVFHAAGRFFLVDGYHRLAAFQMHGREKGRRRDVSVPVVYFAGSPTEAVFAAVERNAQHGVRLTTGERTDAAWKLILIGEKNRAEITRVTMVSRGRLTKMRQVKRQLGDEAAAYRSWRRALHEAAGRSQVELDEEGLAERKRMKAEKIVDQITRAISGEHAADPELMAMVMEAYMGRRYAEFIMVGQSLCSDELDAYAEEDAEREF